MAISDLSFKFYTDSGLTSEFSNLYQLTHQSDLSDNPQDFVLYFGSTQTDRQLQANSDPGTDPVTLTPVETLDNWEAETAYSTGDTIEPSTSNGYRYTATSGGTTGASEPSWPTSGYGSTVSDGTVTWELTAPEHPPSEIKLATSAGGLSSATGGAALTLGTTLLSGTANAVEVHIRVTNTVTVVSNNSSDPELALSFNEVIETAA